MKILNTEKGVKMEDTVENEFLEAVDKARKKTWKETEEVSKRNELLSGFKGEQKNDINKILNISDAHMCQYIRYYFQKRIVNLTKIKKADPKTILSPLLVEYYEKAKATTDVAAAISASSEDTLTFSYGIECGMGDDDEGLSDQYV